MATPVRFPSGLSTFPPRSILGTYPIATSPRQVLITEDFLPYRSGDYTVTQTNGSVAAFNWPTGAVKLATTGSTTGDIVTMTRGTGAAAGGDFQFLLGNQFWYDIKVAYPRSVGNANDTALYFGMTSAYNAPFTSNNDGFYFIKPSGGTTVHFVLKKGGQTTTFQNVADLGTPSGIYGDSNSVNGVLSATIAGNAYTVTAVSTAGAGYQCEPLVLSTSTAGTAGLVPVRCALASTSYTSSNPVVPTQSTGIPYASLGMPYVVNGSAASFTNSAAATTLLEVEPLIDLQVWFDSKGILHVGVNGRETLRIEGTATSLGVNAATGGAGNSYNVATLGPSFYATNQLSTSVAPFQPPTGNAFNIMPLVPLYPAITMANTTANARAVYVMEYNAALELN